MGTKKHFLLVVFVLVFFSFRATSQVHINVFSNQAPDLLVNAGSNTLLCISGSTTLGGTPTASGGTPGYTFSWSPATGLSSSAVSNPVASPSDTTTYTLTLTDAHGCTASGSVTVFTIPCTGIDTYHPEMNVSIFPNPSSEILSIQINGQEIEKSITLSITNGSGQAVYCEHLAMIGNNFSRQIDVSSFPKGIYLIRLTGAKSYFLKKYVKN